MYFCQQFLFFSWMNALFFLLPKHTRISFFATLMPAISLNIQLHAEKSIFSKAHGLTSANIDGKQTNQNSWVDGYMELAPRPHLLSLKSSAECTALRWSLITPAMMWAWSFKCFHRRTPRHYFSFVLCIGVSVSVHFCVVCSSPLVLSHCLHSNHNYNVISRIRQCPRCCFTFSKAPLLWISNTLMLSPESCTAPSQTLTQTGGVVGR